MEINKKYWTQVAKWTKSILSYESFFNVNDLNSLILKTQFIRMDLKKWSNFILSTRNSH